MVEAIGISLFGEFGQWFTEFEMNQLKQQALMEKQLAEQKMSFNDFAGAREHLLKAHQLFPATSNVEAMLTLCDILAAASVELPGCGIDYYWILQVMPSATLSDITCRYQKFFTLLQPIRKNFPCTDRALKLLQDALIVLRDPNKRSGFDLKRGTSWENYRTLSVDLKPGRNAAEIGMCVDSMNLLTSLQPPSRDVNLCSSKAMLNKRPFQDYYDFEEDRKPEHFEPGQIWGVNYKANLHHNYRYARIDSTSKAATCVTWLKPIPFTRSERRWCDAGLPVACGSFDVNLDRQISIEIRWPTISSYRCLWHCGVTEEQLEIYPRKGEIWAVYEDWNIDDWSYNPEYVEGCKFKLVEITSDFSKYSGSQGTCLDKVDGFTSIFERQKMGGNPVAFHIPPNDLYIFSHLVPAYRFKGGEIDKVFEGMFELDQSALPDYIKDNGTIKKQSSSTGILANLSSTMQLPTLKLRSEYEDLMSSWNPEDFAGGQVWSVCWGKDFMPRQYVRINNVISENQVCVTFLEPIPVLDHEIDWMREGLPIACGIFKVGDRRTSIEKALFSCLLKCQVNSSNSCYKIYPLKGEVWAMYKDWNPKWKTSDYESCQCLIVQILSDYSGDGTRIARLGEVKGCLTFFHTQQHNGFDLTHDVSGADVLTFSHRIPAFRVPGIGKYGIPESSWHLKPNALPYKSRN